MTVSDIDKVDAIYGLQFAILKGNMSASIQGT